MQQLPISTTPEVGESPVVHSDIFNRDLPKFRLAAHFAVRELVESPQLRLAVDHA